MKDFYSISFLVILVVSLMARNAIAATPDKIIAANQVNGWVQANVKSTYNVFDFAVQGPGFFILQREGDDGYLYSRQGDFRLDGEGYLIKKGSDARVLGYDVDGHLGPLQLGRAGRRQTAKGKFMLRGFKVDLSGNIMGAYDDGHIVKIACIALALFHNPRRLERVSTHLFVPTDASGASYVGPAQDAGRGSIFASSLEDLDDETYAASLDR